MSLREGYLKELPKEIYILGFSKPEIINGVPELREGIGLTGDGLLRRPDELASSQ